MSRRGWESESVFVWVVCAMFDAEKPGLSAFEASSRDA